MSNERWDYQALHAITDPIMGRVAYNEGDYLMAQVVDDWGLQPGVDVTALRPEQMARPAGNAKRADWAAYALAQGADPDTVDALSRDELRDLYTADAEGAEPAKGD